MSKWEKAAALIFGGFAVVIAAWRIGDYFCLDRNTWPGWVQAIGSVAAIAGAYLLGERQNRVAFANAIEMDKRLVKQRQDAYIAIASAALRHALEIREFFTRYGDSPDQFFMIYDKRKIGGKVKAIEAIPLHEVGTAGKIENWVEFHVSLINFENAVNSYYDSTTNGSDAEARARNVLGHPDRITLLASVVEANYSYLVTSD